MALLDMRDLTKRFAGITAVDNVSLRVHAGEMVALIGPNGAGKSTLFDCLSGLATPESGNITFDGRSLADVAPHERAQIGIGRTFQTPELFVDLTVLENLALAAQAPFDMAVTDHFVGIGHREDRCARETARVTGIFCGLSEYLARYPAQLGLREQRLVELARALCLHPRLLLLDEPASGMNPDETAEFGRTLAKVRDRTKSAMLCVEHDMGLVMSAFDYVYVLDFGRVIASGTPADVQKNEDVLAAYLGSEAVAYA